MSNAEFGQHGWMKCPRCGRRHPESGAALCPICDVRLVPDSGPTGDRHELSVKVRVPPVLRDALASVRPGEDFDEALLRALKARYPEKAAELLSAFGRVIEIEADRANEQRDQTVRRLAELDPGPEITLRTTRGERPTTTTETRVYRVGDKEYHSLEEMPPHLRHMVEEGMRRGGRVPAAPASRVGCSWPLLGALLAGLWCIAGK